MLDNKARSTTRQSWWCRFVGNEVRLAGVAKRERERERRKANKGERERERYVLRKGRDKLDKKINK